MRREVGIAPGVGGEPKRQIRCTRNEGAEVAALRGVVALEQRAHPVVFDQPLHEPPHAILREHTLHCTVNHLYICMYIYTYMFVRIT